MFKYHPQTSSFVIGEANMKLTLSALLLGDYALQRIT